MLKDQKFTKQDILAYFSRPGRSINQARINEISSGHERYAAIPSASNEQLTSYLSKWEDTSLPSPDFAEQSPVHPDLLTLRFSTNNGGQIEVAATESYDVEFKESFNWSNADKYCKTLAGMANNKGGYILFGVEDKTRKIVGIKQTKMDQFDISKLNQFLSQNFSQALMVEKGQFTLSGKTIGSFYVYTSDHKPVICRGNKGLFSSGCIYFRYPGETKSIHEPELTQLLEEKRQRDEERTLKLMAQISSVGGERSAVLNLNSGEIAGTSSSFLLDETLLDKIKFISEGSFDEKAGAPALKLIGDIQPIGPHATIVKHEVSDSITETDIHRAFVSQQCKYNPKAYIKAQINLQPKWFPIFFFAKKAGLSLDELKEVITSASTDYPSRASEQLERVDKGTLPSGPPSKNNVQKYLSEICNENELDITEIDKTKSYLKALRLTNENNSNFEHVLNITKNIWKKYHGNNDLVSYFRNALTTIDKVFIGDKYFY